MYNEIRVFVSAYVWMVSNRRIEVLTYEISLYIHFTLTQISHYIHIIYFRLVSEIFSTLIRRVTSPLNDSYR